MIWRILSKTGITYFARVFEVFFAVTYAFLIVTFVGELMPTGEKTIDGDIFIYVRSNGIHTELCLPTVAQGVDWRTDFPKADFDANISTEFIFFGWGDKGFYMNTPKWGDLTAATAGSALFLPTPTAMHVAYESEPRENEQCVKVHVTMSQYLEISAYVQESFAKKQQKVQLIPGKGYGINDNFYEAKNSYHLFRTCNSWTSGALKKANIRTSILAIFPHGVIRHLRD